MKKKTRNLKRKKTAHQALSYFVSQNFSPLQCLEQAIDLLSPMVTSLFFHSQSNLQTKVVTPHVGKILTQFLVWMQTQKDSSHFKLCLKELQGVKGSDLLILSRYFFRYLETQELKKNPGPPSLRERQISHTLSTHILDSFNANTAALPADYKLAFQLYLDGLTPEEISGLLNEPQKEIDERIQNCKFLIGQKYLKEVA